MNRTQIEIELKFKTSRSGGPGGQNVNKTETQVEVIFDVNESQGLSTFEKLKISEKLTTRIDLEGLLHLVSNTTRSQVRNRREVVARLFQMLDDALIIQKPRKKSKPSKSAIRKRLDSKTKHGNQKKNRGWKLDD